MCINFKSWICLNHSNGHFPISNLGILLQNGLITFCIAINSHFGKLNNCTSGPKYSNGCLIISLINPGLINSKVAAWLVSEMRSIPLPWRHARVVLRSLYPIWTSTRRPCAQQPQLALRISMQWANKIHWYILELFARSIGSLHNITCSTHVNIPRANNNECSPLLGNVSLLARDVMWQAKYCCAIGSLWSHVTRNHLLSCACSVVRRISSMSTWMLILSGLYIFSEITRDLGLENDLFVPK